MDLSTSYLGFNLPHPFIAGASPLSDNLDDVKKLEDAGSAAIILPSLFEEQIESERLNTALAAESHAESFGEALSFLPEPPALRAGPENYLAHLEKVKKAVSVPVIASLNGATDSGWIDYAKTLEEAGADALELNIYMVSTDPFETADKIEKTVLDITKKVTGSIKIPVAVKLSASYTSMPALTKKLVEEGGAKGLVLFNRFFQPEIDMEEIDIAPVLQLSSSSELKPRLAWLGILAGQVEASLAITGGVHTVEDAVKSVMSGADAIQVVSALLQEGPSKLTALKDGLAKFLEDHEYKDLAQMKGSMSMKRCPNPAAYQRVNYMRLLKGFRPDAI